MPARLQEKLMGFQREGIKFALKRGGRLLVGDEMGDYSCTRCMLFDRQPDSPALLACTQLASSFVA